MNAVAPLAALRRALTRIERGDCTTAWQEVTQIAAATPASGAVQLLASHLLSLLGDGRGAWQAARAAAAAGAPAATLLCYQQARELGAGAEACAVLEDALRAGVSGRTGARALDHLLSAYRAAGHAERAAALADTALPAISAGLPAAERPPLLLHAARVWALAGERDRALAATREALAVRPAGVDTMRTAAALCVELAAWDEAARLYETLAAQPATAAEALVALARLRLWHDDHAGALALAERLAALDPASTAARRVRAAVAVRRGDAAAALPLLDAVVRADPRDSEAWLWRAEAHWRLGDRAAAAADADRSHQQGHSFAARALRLLAALRPGGTVHTATWQELSAELTALCPDAPAILARNQSDDLAALIERALAALGGNRTPTGTHRRADGTLAPLPRSQSVRGAARTAMELIRVAPAAEACRHLDALVRAHPGSSMPLVHRGELHLWLGRYEEARADLAGAIAIHEQTRWAWYGLACLDLLAGDPERALATCARGIRVMHDTEGPFAYLVRGEAFRLLGRHGEARVQLEQSRALHPSRLAAWVNLGLVHGVAGDHAGQRAVMQHLAAVAPNLWAEAAAELGDDVFRAAVLEGPLSACGPARDPDPATVDRVLERILAMMRGNRSSSCITYFTADGALRCVPGRRGPHPPAAPRLAKLRALLDRALAAEPRQA